MTLRSSSLLKPRFTRGLVVLFTAAAWLLPSSPASAWGRIGHRVSAELAESLLTPQALAEVKDLLEPGESLADASGWADEIRRERRETGPWHYVNVPINRDHYDSSFCDPKLGCVVSKVQEMRDLLADTSQPKAKRREALRFFVHFLQDMHQPVHVGDRSDRGGNDLQVQFFGRGSNLHRVWDSGLLEHVSDSETVWFDRLKPMLTPEALKSWSKGSVEDWADESFLASKNHAYLDPKTGKPLKSGAKLGEPYEEANLPIAEKRLAQSAVRLASVLNGILR